MLLPAVREGECELIKVPLIRVLAGFRSRPNGSVTAPVIRVSSSVFSHRAGMRGDVLGGHIEEKKAGKAPQ